MKIIRAEHMGMCFGVRDAITLALDKAKEEELSIFGELVHNQTVLSMLEDNGIAIRHSPEDITTRTAMVTAHGASNAALNRLRSTGLNVVEATCPLVHHAHRAVAKLVQAGYHPVIIGKRDHVEVRGITEDLKDYDVVLSEADVRQLQPRPRFGIAAQTTQPIERVRHLVSLIKDRFPESEIRFVDTVCQPTKQRQSAAGKLAREADIVVVIGGANSNNTRELVATCRVHCARVFHVQNADDLCPEWFHPEDIVGITAGTSTPDSTIDEVEQWIARLVVVAH